MRKIFLFILLTTFLDFSFGQKSSMKVDIEELASNKMKGRLSGSKTGAKAAKYIAERFKEIGLMPMGDNETFFQNFSIPSAKIHGNEFDSGEVVSTMNVVGFINNGNSNRNAIVIGAHLDHLGLGHDKSKHTGKKEIHYGADDNASGVAMILYLAEKLKNRHMKNNFIIVAFAAEEQGLLGSKYFVNHPPPNVKIRNINCMLNFDMVGRLNHNNELIMTGSGTSPKWNSLLRKMKLEGATIKQDPSGLGRSDHTYFYINEVPVLNFFTGIHDDYHKPSDTPDKIDYEGMQKIAVMAIHIIEEVDAVIKLAYTTTEDEKTRRVWENPEKSTRKYKVTLGVIPDYTFSSGGMRIESVIPERPAFSGGMKDGDIVIQLGAHEVGDLQTYMNALSHFNSGDKVTVKFKRSGEIMETEIVF